MKKEIVFVIPSLSAGGAEKSLVNLLNTIDYSVYSVDLLLFHSAGIFLPMLPKEVRVIAIEGNYSTFSKPLSSSVFQFFFQLKWHLVYHRLVFFFKHLTLKNKAVAEQTAWINSRSAIPDYTKAYDAAIGFLEKSSIYMVVDQIKAKKKIGWIHTNYSNSGMNPAFDALYFEKLDAIVGVSPECAEDLKATFPLLTSKIKVIYNIISSPLIRSLATEKVVDFSNTPNILLSVGRLSHEKGFDLALEACKILKERGVLFQWIIIGDGQDRVLLEEKRNAYDLTDSFQLIGLKENPYPYIKACTIYVQPSRYEGKSMAIEEAKILAKPIVVTNFTTALDQIQPGVNGIIAEMHPEGIATAIQNLLDNQELQNQLSLNLSKEELGTSSEIQKLYTLIHE